MNVVHYCTKHHLFKGTKFLHVYMHIFLIFLYLDISSELPI